MPTARITQPAEATAAERQHVHEHHAALIADVAGPDAGVRHYLVNSPHMDMAQHKTTYALLRELLPLHGCSPGELQARLDQMTQRAFIAGASSLLAQSLPSDCRITVKLLRAGSRAGIYA